MGPLECRRGVLLLTAASIRVLGGGAEEMGERGAANQVLAERLARGDEELRDRLLAAPARAVPLPLLPAQAAPPPNHRPSLVGGRDCNDLPAVSGGNHAQSGRGRTIAAAQPSTSGANGSMGGRAAAPRPAAVGRGAPNAGQPASGLGKRAAAATKPPVANSFSNAASVTSHTR